MLYIVVKHFFASFLYHFPEMLIVRIRGFMGIEHEINTSTRRVFSKKKVKGIPGCTCFTLIHPVDLEITPDFSIYHTKNYEDPITKNLTRALPDSYLCVILVYCNPEQCCSAACSLISQTRNEDERRSTMKMVAVSLLLMTGMLLVPLAFAGKESPANPRVRLETNHGNIIIELYPQQAPKTVDNFLQYVSSGAYSGTIFHRVIRGFMIQGGGFTPDMNRKPTRGVVMNEADNGLRNLRGTVAMARTAEPHSATSQFFINTVNNYSLDYRESSVSGWGYCVFGKVVEGMDVVDAIEKLPTTSKGMHRDVPASPAVITKAVLLLSQSGE